MTDPWGTRYPATVPAVEITPIVGEERAVTCEELQWWFAVPRIGDRFGTAWYDRATGELTMVRDMAGPVSDAGVGDGSVRIDIDEWTRQPGSTETVHTPLAYWQYRPTSANADSEDWIATHPGVELIIDDHTFQRRNCTGRDEIALAAFALGLLPLG